MNEQEIVNKVAQSGLIQLNLEDFSPEGERIVFDLKDYLFQDLILKEKEFRSALKSIEWPIYKNKHVAIDCSTDAIIPTWAFMLVAVYLQPYSQTIIFGDLDALESELFRKTIAQLDVDQYRDERIIIQGCGNKPVPKSAYVEITRILQPVAKSIMFGEACSTVPLFKNG